MNKREFLKKTAILSAGVAVAPLLSCATQQKGIVPAVAPPTASGTLQPVALKPLPYAFNALEPAIDAQTMEIHHDKHHQAYVNNLNAAMEKNPEGAILDVRSFCQYVHDGVPALRNNGGGHINHDLFWNILTPGGSKQPQGVLLDMMMSSFGTMEEFSRQFSDAAKTRFGSGWAWLSLGPDNKLFVSSTPNQDNPMMRRLVDKPGEPVLGIDVWEHAYYLKYQNRRPDYISSFMGIINWDVVSGNLDRALKQSAWSM